jgi:hydrogenase small subunit
MSASLIGRVRQEFEKGSLVKRNLVWLELNGCSGNIISLLNAESPDIRYLITQMTNFIYSNSLVVAEGSAAMEQLFSVIGSDYILAVEGAISLKANGIYNIIGRYRGNLITGRDALTRLGENAAHVIAVALSSRGRPLRGVVA